MSLVVKYVNGRNPLISDLQGDPNVESDCDEHIPGVQDELPSAKGKKKETRAVLITGSFSAYVRLDISSLSRKKRRAFQLEIFVLLPLHRHDPVRTPQVTRRRLTLEFHLQQHDSSGPSPLLTEDHLCSCEPGKVTSNEKFGNDINALNQAGNPASL
jgi:hypothetical protein